MGPETRFSMETISGRPDTPPKSENSQAPKNEPSIGSIFDKKEIAKTYEGLNDNGLSINKEDSAEAQQIGQEKLKNISEEQAKKKEESQRREKHNKFQSNMEKQGGIQLKSIKPNEQKVPGVISEKTTDITAKKPEFSQIPKPVSEQTKAQGSDGTPVNEFYSTDIPQKVEEGLKFENEKTKINQELKEKTANSTSREPKVFSHIKESAPQPLDISNKIFTPSSEKTSDTNIKKQEVNADFIKNILKEQSIEPITQSAWEQQKEQIKIKNEKKIDTKPLEEKPVEIKSQNQEVAEQQKQSEAQEKQIEKDKKISIKSLEGKLIKTGFLNLETAHKLVINILSGEKDPWGKAKGDFSQEQWNKAQDMLKSRVGKVIERIQQFDRLNMDFLKQDTKLFGKYIDNLEQTLKTPEYASLPISEIQEDLADIKGLMELNATNLKQWKGKNKGVRGLIKAFKLGVANLINDPEGKIQKSIDAEDQKLLQALKDSNGELTNKLNALKKQLEGDIEAIPENIAPSKETSAPIENASNLQPNALLEQEKQEDIVKMKTLLANIGKSNAKIAGHNYYASGQSGTREIASNALQELKSLVDKHPDIKEIDMADKKINLNDEIAHIQSDLAFSSGFEAAQKQVKPEAAVPTETPVPEKPVITPAPTQEKKRLFARRMTQPASQESVVDNKVKLSPETRGKLDSLIKDYAPDPTDQVRNSTNLEKLMEMSADKNLPAEYKDIVTLQMLNFPNIKLDNLEFDAPVGESEDDRKKALAEKVNTISQKYLSTENDPLSLSVEKLSADIEQKYDLKPKNVQEMPTPGTIAPQGAAVPNTVETNAVGNNQ